ncbi:MAG TPA: 3-phosphoglycerate dehydrogenase [Christensenellaceae bacterium]|nr:3-phosphoglycerate dehydrogenase [Christensenellaceae bacterium]
MKERNVVCLNPISPKGLERLGANYAIVHNAGDADCWLVRSADLHGKTLPSRLRAIGRAGAGVNNIPLDACVHQGIVVFNTPGANANAVAELVIAGMLMASRDIVGGINWLRTLEATPDIGAKVEKGKKNFAGTELRGKKLGVIGLGAIGHLVANVAVSLGMEVYGYDPYISVNYAWRLSRSVRHVENLEKVLKECDYITIHVPLMDATRMMIGAQQVAMMKEGVILLNFSRDSLVDEKAVGATLQNEKIRKYVTEFVNEKNVAFTNTIIIPHLGASTEESEENCAVMVVEEVQDYLNNGNIANSVNFPAISLGSLKSPTRVVVLHNNVPGIISKITTLFSNFNFNIEQMISASRGSVACALFDVEQTMQREFAMQLSNQDNILKVRVIQKD